MVNENRDAPRQQRAVETRAALLLGAARVFARMSYNQARLKDIARESGISEGALYFHFGTKAQVAEAVLAEQQVRMSAALEAAMGAADTGLAKLFAAIRGLGVLMAADEVVQAGIKLAAEPAPELARAAHDPYFAWIGVARSLLELGIRDGSVRAGLDVDAAAEFANYSFVGAQMLAGMADGWRSLPQRLRVVEEFLDSRFAATG